MGIHVGGETGLFNLLMSEAVLESPLDLAREEGRREVMDEYRERYKKARRWAGAPRRAQRGEDKKDRGQSGRENRQGESPLQCRRRTAESTDTGKPRQGRCATQRDTRKVSETKDRT